MRTSSSDLPRQSTNRNDFLCAYFSVHSNCRPSTAAASTRVATRLATDRGAVDHPSGCIANSLLSQPVSESPQAIHSADSASIFYSRIAHFSEMKSCDSHSANRVFPSREARRVVDAALLPVTRCRSPAASLRPGSLVPLRYGPVPAGFARLESSLHIFSIGSGCDEKYDQAACGMRNIDQQSFL